MRLPSNLVASLLAPLFVGATAEPGHAGPSDAPPPAGLAARERSEAADRVLAALCGGCGPDAGVACVAHPASCAEAWEFRATLPIWIPSISGSFASGGTKVDADRGSSGIDGELSLVSDAATELDFFFVGRFSARKGPWSLAAEGYYADITRTIDWRVRDEDATGSLAAGIFRLHGAWQSACPLADSPCAPILSVGPLVGVRAYAIDIDVDPATGPDISKSRFWVDPVVGVKAELTFAGGASVRVLADVGGGLVGSDLSWSLAADVSFPLGRGWSIEVGWEILDIDHGVPVGSNSLGVNLHLSGPHLGVTYEF